MVVPHQSPTYGSDSPHNNKSQLTTQTTAANIPTAFLFGNIDSFGNLDDIDEPNQDNVPRENLFDQETIKAFSSANISKILGTSEALSDMITSQERCESTDSFDDNISECFDEIEEMSKDESKSNSNKTFPNKSLLFDIINRFVVDVSSKVLDSKASNCETLKPAQLNIEKILFDIEKLKQTTKRNDRISIFKPLENLLPPFYSQMNITDIFPFFVDNKPLRFFKLFSSIYHEEYFPKYHNFSVPQAIHLDYYLSQIESVDAKKASFLSSSSNKKEEISYIHGNQRINQNSNFLYRFKQHGSKNLSDWIDGPAGLWYKNQTFSLSGFTLNEMDSFTNNYGKKSIINSSVDILDKSWLDKIIFDSNSPASLEQQRQTNADKLDRQQSMAGWVLSSECHSYEDYCTAKNQECFINDNKYMELNKYLKPVGKEPHPLGSKIFSMFCHEEPSQIDSIKWDDKVLWNIDRKDKSMHIPLSFCIKDPYNRSNKFQRIFKTIINNAKNHSTLDLNCFISELGDKIFNEIPKAVKMPTIQTEILDKSKSSSNSHQNSNQFALKHAVPVEQLHPLLFPTFFSISKLRTFHRHPLRRFSHGNMSELSKFHDVQIIKLSHDKFLDRQIKDVVMKDFDALSAQDGCIVLFEYLEQFPLFLNQVGMASALINYKRIKAFNKQLTMKNWKPEDQAELHYVLKNKLVAPSNDDQELNADELFFGTKTIEISNLNMPGQPPYNKVVQCFENNMYKSMVVKHTVCPNDFLLIRTRENIFLREINGIFSVGQQIPQMEVLTPWSKQAVAFNRDFFKVYVYRLFRIAKEDGYRVKMDDIKKAFPNTSENTLRKRLKHCADFKRLGCAANKNGNLVNYWILRDDFIIPDETVVSKMVSPEECCSFYSMITAYQRLRDNGYVNKLVSLDEEDNLLDNQVRMEDELLAAPWNTSKTYLECQRGRAQYQVYGNADPTGSNQGFSFVKRVVRPPRDDTYLLNAVQAIRKCENHRKIEAAIKRLSIGEARRLLSLYDFIDKQEIMELNKWSIIERIISTYREHRDYPLSLPMETLELMPENDQQSLAARKESYGFLQQRFKTDCQTVFDAQYELLSTKEPQIMSFDLSNSFSSPFDTNSTTKINSEQNEVFVLENSQYPNFSNNKQSLEQLGQNIEQMLAEDNENFLSKNTSKISRNYDFANQSNIEANLNFNDKQKIEDNLPITQKSNIASSEYIPSDEFQIQSIFHKKKLRIRRSFRDDEGRLYSRIELVTNPSIIERYVHDRQPPDTPQDDWEFSGKGFKDWQHNYNKRIHGTAALRKRKKPLNAAPPRKRPKSEKVLKLKCGACGQVGHMKSNKDCPYYQRTQAKMISRKNSIQMKDSGINGHNSSAILIDSTHLNLTNTNLNIESSNISNSKSQSQKTGGLFSQGDVWVKFDGNQVVFSKNIVKKPIDTQKIKKIDDAFEFDSWFRNNEDTSGAISYPDNFESEITAISNSHNLFPNSNAISGYNSDSNTSQNFNSITQMTSGTSFKNVLEHSKNDMSPKIPNNQIDEIQNTKNNQNSNQNENFLIPYQQQLDFAKQHQMMDETSRNYIKENIELLDLNSTISPSANKLLSFDDSNDSSHMILESQGKRSSFFPLIGTFPKKPLNSGPSINDLLEDSSDSESLSESKSNINSKANDKYPATKQKTYNYSPEIFPKNLQFIKSRTNQKSIELDTDILYNLIDDNIFRSSHLLLHDEVNKYLQLFTFIKCGSPKYIFNQLIIHSINHLMTLEFAEPFIFPVDETIAPNYYSIIIEPLCLTQILEKARSNKYNEFKQVEDEFIQIVNNSKTYNGTQSPFTLNAKNLISEYKKFLFSNRLSISFINLINSPHDSKNANFILAAYLCHIVTILAQSEVGLKLLHSDALQCDISQIYFHICYFKYTNFKSFHFSLMKLCEVSQGLKNSDLREIEIKSFSTMVQNLISTYESTLKTLFSIIDPQDNQKIIDD